MLRRKWCSGIGAEPFSASYKKERRFCIEGGIVFFSFVAGILFYLFLKMIVILLTFGGENTIIEKNKKGKI